MAGVASFDNSQQLDRVAKLVSELNIAPCDSPNPLHVNLFRVNPKTVRQGGENANLMLGVVTVDVQGGLRLRITLRLCIFQHLAKIGPLELHPREDVVAGPIDDPVQVSDAVAHKSLA